MYHDYDAINLMWPPAQQQTANNTSIYTRLEKYYNWVTLTNNNSGETATAQFIISFMPLVCTFKFRENLFLFLKTDKLLLRFVLEVINTSISKPQYSIYKKPLIWGYFY